MDYEFWQKLDEQKKRKPTTAPESDNPKGKPLTHNFEADTRQTEACKKATFYTKVPAELKARHQWVLWKEEKRNGKITKIPKTRTGRNAAANKPETWMEFPQVASIRDRFSGIGFVFAKADPYCGIDLDNCLDEHKKIKDWAKTIVKKLKTVAYGEVSPSGNGIKFWTRAKLPASAKHKVYLDEAKSEAIEIYDHTRFFTVTGNGKGIIADGQAVVDWIVQEYLTKTPQPQAPPPAASNLSTDEVIAKIRESKQAPKFNALMNADTTGYGSQSEADIALCAIIAFWTQAPAAIDAIFRQSKLYNRPKWDEKHRADGATYGTMTIEKALSGNRETYTPQQTQKGRKQELFEMKRKAYRNRKRYGG